MNAERRGDRRPADKPWKCRGTRPAMGPHLGPLSAAALVPCNAGVASRMQDELGHVWCSLCGKLDRRSTAGNRRRAREELAALERRIERELHDTNLRLANLEHHVRDAGLALPAARKAGST